MGHTNLYDMSLEYPETAGGQAHIRIVLDEIKNDNVYDFAVVKDKIVLDIGAFCGETMIYFSRRGAKWVFGLEPLKSFELIDINLKQNNVNNATPIRGAISFDNSKTYINPEFVNDGGSRMQDAKGSYEIPTYSLQGLVDLIKQQFPDDKDYVLKLDCEGGEFNCIPGSSKETLRLFQVIMLEYHKHSGDEKELIQYIRDCGFNVFSRPHFSDTGLLYAKRID